MLEEKIVIAGRTAQNRVVINPMEGCDCNKDGSPSELTEKKYLDYAKSGAAIIWFFIMPARLQSQMQGYNKTLTDYSEQLSNKNAENQILNDQIEKLEKTVERVSNMLRKI